jgi:flavin reductase (DIM6/NTAB) family NADH-FMN oxidoreductase RutF
MATVIPSSELSGSQRYRLLTSLVVPRPIAWVGTRSLDGTPNLAPFSYFNAVSAAPMLVAVSIGSRRSREGEGATDKDTLVNIRETGVFSVSVVAERQLEAMVRTSGEWAPAVDEFREAGLTAAECDSVAAPCVADAPAVLECTLFRLVELGASPNTLVLGEVEAVRLAPELVVDHATGHVDVRSLRPVGRLGLDEYTLLGELRHVPRPDPARAPDREWNAGGPPG